MRDMPPPPVKKFDRPASGASEQELAVSSSGGRYTPNDAPKPSTPRSDPKAQAPGMRKVKAELTSTRLSVRVNDWSRNTATKTQLPSLRKIVYHPSLNAMVVASDRVLQRWVEQEHMKEVLTITHSTEHRTEGHITCLTYCATGQRLLVGDSEGFVCLYAGPTLELTRTFRFEADEDALGGDGVVAVRFVNQDRFLVCLPGEIVLCNCANDNRTTFAPESTRASFCSMMVTGLRSFVTGSSDGSLRMWSLDSYEPELAIMRAHDGAVQCLAHSPETNLLISSAADRFLRVWHADSLECVTHIDPHRVNAKNGDIVGIVFHPENNMFVCVDNSGDVRFWSTTTFQLLSHITRAHEFGANDVAAAPDGLRTVTVGNDPAIKMWSTKVFAKIEHSFSLADGYLTSMCALPNNTMLTGTIKGTIYCWRRDAHHVQRVFSVSGHKDVVWGLAHSPTNPILVSVSSDKRMVVWDTSGADALQQVHAVPNAHALPSSGAPDSARMGSARRGNDRAAELMSVAFAPNGEYFFTGSAGGMVRAWQVGHPIPSYEPWADPVACGVPNSVLCLSVSFDNRVVLGGMSGTDVGVWVVQPNRRLLTVQGTFAAHTADVRDVVFLHNSRTRFATASADRTVGIWELNTKGGKDLAIRLHTLTDMQGAVRSVFQSVEDSFLFVACDYDGIRGYHMGEGNGGDSGTELSLQVHIEEASALGRLSHHSDLLFSCHGKHVLSWDWRVLHSLPDRLQPLHGLERSATSVIRLPHVWSEHEVVHVHHICVPQTLRSDFDDETTQAINSIPYLSGALLYTTVLPTRTASGKSDEHLPPSRLLMVERIGALCEQMQQFSLRPDAAYSWGEGDEEGDALDIVIQSGDRAAVGLLLSILQSVWVKRSMAHIFTARHMTLLLRRFPDLLVAFLVGADPANPLPELCIERPPTFVQGNCDRARLRPGKSFVAGSQGREPHAFWEKKKDWLERSGSRRFEIPCHALTLGVRDIPQSSKQVLKAALDVSDIDIARRVFNLKCINYLEKYQAHEQRGQQRFKHELVLYSIHLGLFVALALLLVAGARAFESGTRNVAALVIACLSLVSATRLVAVEMEQFSSLDGIYTYIVKDNWNKLDALLLSLHFSTIFVFFADKPVTASRLASVEMVLLWVKLVSYLRLYKRFSFLLRALFQITSDIKSFVVILLVTVVAFGLSMHVLFKNSENEYEGGSASTFGDVGDSLLSAFSMLLGNFDERVFVDAKAVGWLTTILFCLFMLVAYIMMLTVLISIVSETFLEVKERSVFEGRKERSAMLLEHAVAVSSKQRQHWLQILTTEPAPLPSNEPRASLVDVVVRPQRQQPIVPQLRDPKTMPRDEVEKTFDLGEFAIVPTQLQFQVRSFGANVYEIGLKTAEKCRHLDYLDSLGVLNTGQFSPQAAVTLSKEAKRQAMIPENAAYFAVAYPLVGVDHLDEGLKLKLALADPSFGFLLYGGFLYFDQKHEPVRANAFLAGGKGLKFAGPYKWHAELFTPELHNQNRFHPITIQALRNTGARLFAWINPGEVLKTANGEFVDSGITHGGFVYLFHDAPLVQDPRDCFFVVSE